MPTMPRSPDEKITNLIKSLPPSSVHFSLEFFPPKTQAGFTNLQGRLSRMTTALRPLFVTVTWGAGGSTATKSLELAEICQRQLGVPTVLHLTCTNMNQELIDEALEECRNAGIRNILALRGDPPREEYKDPTPPNTPAKKTNGIVAKEEEEEEFVWAVDLVRYIRRKYGDYFCIGVAGYPEGHADESNPEVGKQNVEHDLPYLVEKVKAGADFIMTQLTYNVEAYRNYEARLRSFEDGGKKLFEHIPIIPGLMPIQSYQIIKRITKLAHSKIPESIASRIEEVKSDDELVKRVGVEIMSEIVESIRNMPLPEGLPRILHFYTLNLEKSVSFILERCKLIQPTSEPESSSSAEESDVAVDGINMTNGKTESQQQRRHSRRASSLNAQPHNRVILDMASPQREVSNSMATPVLTKHEASEGAGTGIPASKPSRAHNLLISEGQGSLGREATWDDFPNGRWGPSHSPAFGEIDGYGPSLKVGPITARKLWRHPKTHDDVTEIFRRHVTGKLRAVPWSDNVDVDTISPSGDGALRAETDIIRKELLQLIEGRRFWTVASQPAVDGVKSDHPIFGWGPKGEGFVFQKAFVEFFCFREDWEELREKLMEIPATEFSWMKTDANGAFESTETISRSKSNGVSSSKKTPGSTGVNAVTWGVFRGREIITPTIIEAESFRAWGEEAYSIWGEWRRCFPRGSQEEQCLESLRKDVVLLSIVGQDFRGGNDGQGHNLWDMLLNNPRTTK